MPVPLPKENYYTLADALTWDEGDRIELINGRPIMMSSPARVHQDVSRGLVRQLINYLEGKKCTVYYAPFTVRPFEKEGDRPEDVDTLVEPDISVICDPDKLDDIGCKGAPDLIMEILSPSNQRHDRFTKFDIYQRAGVREYWIVDPSIKSVQVFLLEDGRYTLKDYGEEKDTVKVNILEDCSIDLSLVFPR